MRRNALKVLHWTVFPLLLYFFFVEPEHVSRLPDAASKTAALATHAGMGLILAGLVAIWTLTYWRYGQAGRPGPKLSDRAKRFHYWGHRALYWALPITMVTGALAGLAAPFAVMGFGVVSMNIAGDGGLHGAAKDGRSLTLGAYRAGLSHAAACIGCCWALMLLMFVVGMSNLAWMLGLTAIMAVEKNFEFGARLSAPMLFRLPLCVISRSLLSPFCKMRWSPLEAVLPAVLSFPVCWTSAVFPTPL